MSRKRWHSCSLFVSVFFNCTQFSSPHSLSFTNNKSCSILLSNVVLKLLKYLTMHLPLPPIYTTSCIARYLCNSFHNVRVTGHIFKHTDTAHYSFVHITSVTTHDQTPISLTCVFMGKKLNLCDSAGVQTRKQLAVR